MDIINQDKNINLETKWDDFRFIDLFAGIGGIRLGFEAVGGRCVFSSELDADACKTYEANFGEYPFGDITKIEDLPYADFWTVSFPCQSISVAGKMKGLKPDSGTRSSLLWDNIRLLSKAKENNNYSHTPERKSRILPVIFK